MAIIYFIGSSYIQICLEGNCLHSPRSIYGKINVKLHELFWTKLTLRRDLIQTSLNVTRCVVTVQAARVDK